MDKFVQVIDVVLRAGSCAILDASIKKTLFVMKNGDQLFGIG